MYEDGLLVAVWMGSADPPQEVEEGRGMAGDAKVWPRDEVELTHFLCLIILGLWEGGREGRREGGREGGEGGREGGRTSIAL